MRFQKPVLLTAIVMLSVGSVSFAQTREADLPTRSGDPADLVAPNEFHLQDYGFPAAEVRAVPGARARAAAARMEHIRARSDLYRTVDWTRDDLQHSPEFSNAVDEEESAYRVYDAERNRVVTALFSDTDFATLYKLRNQINERLIELRDSPKPDADEIMANARLKLDYGTRLREMESKALADDEAVQDAWVRLSESASRLAVARADLDRTVRRSDDVIAARVKFEDARTTRVATAAYSNAVTDARNIAVDYAYDVLNKQRAYAVYSDGYDRYDSRYHRQWYRN